MLTPRDELDLAEILTGRGGPFEPVGGASKRSIGRVQQAELLDLSLLRGILAYEPRELTLTARAGTPLTEIERVLQAEGQCLAFEPPNPSSAAGASAATLGGVLATNSSGSRRVTSGAARDHFLGFRAVSGRGERFRGGGRVVKNVTGYDLPKLLAGSWGTLAVLTEVTVRVHPLPEVERTLIVPCAPAAAIGELGRALSSPWSISGAAFLPREGIALRLEGFAESVAARAAALLELLAPASHLWLEGDRSRELWRAIALAAPLGDCELLWRIATAPSQALKIIERLEPRDYLLDWGGGLIWMAGSPGSAAQVREAIGPGHALLVRAPAAVRALVPTFQPLPPALAALAARLKEAFDPARKLNPDRLL